MAVNSNFRRELRSGRSYTTDPYEAFGPPPSHVQQQIPRHAVPIQGMGAMGNQPLNSQINAAGDTLSAIHSMLESVPPTSPFESNLFNCMNLLIAQFREIKDWQRKVDERSGVTACLISEMKLATVKTEQYSRRDCVTVTGVPKAEGETSQDLGPKVASALSKSGVPVKVEELSAFHRNQGKERQVKLRDGTTKTIPPTITVKFRSVNQKDEVVKNYKNFDHSKKKPNDIQVYHSLSQHYAKLRRQIIEYYGSDNGQDKAVKWVRYLSPSAGLAVKLKSEEFVKNVHVWSDFLQFARG